MATGDIARKAPPPGQLPRAAPAADEPDGDEAGGQEAAEESAFADLRDALKSGDDKAGSAALKEYLELCGYTKSG